jgi:hypothetical protein
LLKGLNIRHETLKLLQDKIQKTLYNRGIGNFFLTRTPIAQGIRVRIDKWDYLKLKSFYTSKEIVMGIKTQPIE